MKKYFTTGHKVEQYTETDTGFGGPTYTWTEKLTLDARLRPLSGEERLSADKQTLHTTHKLYCDVLDITEQDRYVDPDGNIYHIVFVKNPMNMDRHLEIDLEFAGHTEAEEEENG